MTTTSPSPTTTTAPSDTEPSDTEPSDTEPSDTEPSDTEPSDTEPSDTEPSDTEPSDTEVEPTSCEVPEVFVGCEGIVAPAAEVSDFARGIIVEADRAVLTFADVNAPDLLCGESGLLECSCLDWNETSRFTIDAALVPGIYGPAQVSLLSAGGDCDTGGAEFDEVVVELEITEVTDTCVAGRVQIEDGLGALPTDFGFVAPRCD